MFCRPIFPNQHLDRDIFDSRSSLVKSFYGIFITTQLVSLSTKVNQVIFRNVQFPSPLHQDYHNSLTLYNCSCNDGGVGWEDSTVSLSLSSLVSPHRQVAFSFRLFIPGSALTAHLTCTQSVEARRVSHSQHYYNSLTPGLARISTFDGSHFFLNCHGERIFTVD